MEGKKGLNSKINLKKKKKTAFKHVYHDTAKNLMQVQTKRDLYM